MVPLRIIFFKFKHILVKMNKLFLDTQRKKFPREHHMICNWQFTYVAEEFYCFCVSVFLLIFSYTCVVSVWAPLTCDHAPSPLYKNDVGKGKMPDRRFELLQGLYFAWTGEQTTSIQRYNKFRLTESIDLMYNDVTRPEMQYGSCSHTQIQDGGH